MTTCRAYLELRGEVEGAELELRRAHEDVGRQPDENDEQDDVDDEAHGHASGVRHAGLLEQAAEQVGLRLLCERRQRGSDVVALGACGVWGWDRGWERHRGMGEAHTHTENASGSCGTYGEAYIHTPTQRMWHVEACGADLWPDDLPEDVGVEDLPQLQHRDRDEEHEGDACHGTRERRWSS